MPVGDRSRLSRLEVVNDGNAFSIDRAFAYPLDLKSLRFDTAHGSISLEVELDRDAPDHRIGVTHCFRATPRVTGGTP